MRSFRLRPPTTLGVVLLALNITACRDAIAPAPVGSAPTTVVASVLVVNAKKHGPVIQSVQLSTTSLELNNGSAASYSVTIHNPFGRTSRTYTDVYLQGEIRQGGVVAAAGGGQVSCNGGPYAVLPLGTCIVSSRTISTIPGAGSLTPGAAIFAVTLYSQGGAFEPVTVTVPVMLGDALITP